MPTSRLLARAIQRPPAKRVLKPSFVRNLAAVHPVTVSTDPVTKTSTLSNGLSVSTETTPGTNTSTVGLWIDAGSRADASNASGTAHFLEHLAFKGTKARSQTQLELEVENLGAHLNAYTSREQTVYYAKAFDKDVPQAVDILSDILQNSKLEESAIERERDVILREQEEVEKQPEEVVFDHLHAVAFQEHINSISKKDLQSYISNNYTADRMALIGAGSIEHETLVKLAEKHFASLPVSSNPIPLGDQSHSPAEFIGSEVRIRDDTMDTLNVAISVEGVGWKSPDYWPMLVMQSIFGNWDRSLGASSLLSSRLSHIISSNNLANSYMSFSTSYSDTGLWGIYLVTEKEWTRMSISPTIAEVERAKSQLKASLLLGLDGTTAIAEDIGRQLITTGKRYTPREIERYVDAVTPAEIQRVAQKYLWDKDIAIAALGRVDGLFDYTRIRADMSSMLF
ncbi:mitochondrial-processing peptidase subunit beta [Cryptococcus depauperatus CBS 7841]|uniref:mitochondrial processing peptidase n=1 Tax=Cryptococcus depauperatus CBS 7841 TaxID=1295531 RepID=A0AAJ8JPM5_9TREE